VARRGERRRPARRHLAALVRGRRALDEGVRRPGALGLTYRGTSQDSLTSSLGVQLDTRIDLEDGRLLTPFARVAWVHDFETERSIDGFLTTSPVVRFTAFGASAAEDFAKVNAGFRLDLTDRVGVFAYFDGELSDHSRSYAGNGGIRIAW
jgi:outer membrane autotransporter protein